MIKLIADYFTRIYLEILYILYFRPLVLHIIFLLFYFYIVDYSLIHCQPLEGQNWEHSPSSSTPSVNMEGKPVFIPHGESNNDNPTIYVTAAGPEYNNDLQYYYNSNSTTRATLGASNTETNSFISEMSSEGLNLSIEQTSCNSIAVQNGSVPSHFHELGAETSPNLSICVEPGSPRSSLIELGLDNDNIGTISMDYKIHNPAGVDDSYKNLGYLAPSHTRIPSPCDPTEYVHPAPIGYRIVTSLKKLNPKKVKFYGMGKRRLFWEIWEKDTGNYDCYRDFKKSWNPDTKIRKVIWSDIKASGKNIKTSFNVSDIDRGIKQRTYNETQNLLRKNNPFRK